MEGLAPLFSELYNKFLLRDFVGKIVPGAVLLFSIGSLALPTPRLRLWLSHRTLGWVAIVAGIAWTLTLGLQSAGEWAGLWDYFPRSTSEIVTVAPDSFRTATLRVDQFLATATDGQKLQYERFVVIKEACGNLFLAICLALPCWVVIALVGNAPFRKPRATSGLLKVRHNASVAVRSVTAILTGIVLAMGLYRMHRQHVDRQWMYATESRAAPPAAPKPPENGYEFEGRIRPNVPAAGSSPPAKP